jgi:hypothetical protein
MRVPQARPSTENLNAAFEALDAYFLHFYQLLYFQATPMTQPGQGHGRPFNLKWSLAHTHCIQVEVMPWSGRREEFDFLITPQMTDEEVLAKCGAILQAIGNGKSKVHDMACCPLAEHNPCVCAYSFKCAIHGERHIGTHD